MYSPYKIFFSFFLTFLISVNCLHAQQSPSSAAKALKVKMKSMFIYQFAKMYIGQKHILLGIFTIGIYGSKDLYNLLTLHLRIK